MTHSLATSLVFIDAAVDNYQSLIDGVISGVEVIVLDPTQDGVEAITKTLAHRRNLNSIHIVSHGAPGCLYLGSSQLSLDTFHPYTERLQIWKTALSTETGSILLYGCNVAAGDAGEQFIQALHRLTQAHISASRTLTGSSALGGNWQLEVTTGEVATLAFEPATLQRYEAVLITKTVSPTEPFEVVGARVGELDFNNNNNLSTWFPDAYLGTAGGPSGTANGSSGFGIRLFGNQGRVSAVEGTALLFVNDQALTPSRLTVTSGLIWKRPGDTNPEYQDLEDSPNGNFTAFSPIITAEPVPMSGLNVTLQYKFDGNFPLLRSYITFENPTDAPITVPIGWATNFAYDATTVIQGTQSGDTTFTVDDRWIVADDIGENFDGAAIGQLFYGPGTPGIKPVSATLDAFDAGSPGAPDKLGTAVNFNLTVPANSTRAMLFFTSNTRTTANAFTTIVRADTNTNIQSNSLFEGLSAQQLAQTVNWDFGTGINISPIGSGTTTEAGGQATFGIALKSQPSSDVTVNFASSNPAEGVVSTSTLTFTPSNWNQPQVLNITGVDDAVDDGDVTYSILTNFTSTDSLYSVNEPTDITLANLDNDNPPAPLPVEPDGGIGGSGGGSGGGNGGSGGNGGGSGGGGSDDDADPGNLTPGKLIKGNVRKNRLVGGEGNDRILGFGQNDQLIGKGGNDILAGGQGRNRLRGGAGVDLFVLGQVGTAIVSDFQNNLDRLGLTKGLKFGSLDVVRRGANTLIKEDDEVLAVLQGIKPGRISAADFTKV